MSICYRCNHGCTAWDTCPCCRASNGPATGTPEALRRWCPKCGLHHAIGALCVWRRHGLAR